MSDLANIYFINLNFIFIFLQRAKFVLKILIIIDTNMALLENI